MYLAIYKFLANDVVEFPFTVGVFNLRDIARPCEAWKAIVTIALSRA